jgi:hypothetical protein
MGANIQENINKLSGDIHLITCGNVHIIDNPLYNYIEPPIGTFGVVDETPH